MFAEAAAAAGMAEVLIPLNSGLVFVSSDGRKVNVQTRLNPFEFRAGICLVAARLMAWHGGLNPFEFRAGICFYSMYSAAAAQGLNPFEFRAGICFQRQRRPASASAS